MKIFLRFKRLPAYLLLALSISVLAAPHAFAASTVHGSKNWAGYEMLNGYYTSVSGSWIVSTSTPTNDIVSADAAWVGIGGTLTDDLIQTGTQAVFINGKPQYIAWMETLPDAQRALPVTVAPGDSVSASLTETSPNQWHLLFVNHTTGGSYDTIIPYVSKHSSAEWVIERPLAITGEGTGYLPLNNFGTLTFTNAQATTNGVTATLDDQTGEKIVMTPSATTVSAAPSTASQGSFAISYLSQPEGKTFLQIAAKSSVRAQIPVPQTTRVVLKNIVPKRTTYIVHIVFTRHH